MLWQVQPIQMNGPIYIYGRPNSRNVVFKLVCSILSIREFSDIILAHDLVSSHFGTRNSITSEIVVRGEKTSKARALRNQMTDIHECTTCLERYHRPSLTDRHPTPTQSANTDNRPDWQSRSMNVFANLKWHVPFTFAPVHLLTNNDRPPSSSPPHHLLQPTKPYYHSCFTVLVTTFSCSSSTDN